jgi:hypothetical protein
MATGAMKDPTASAHPRRLTEPEFEPAALHGDLGE